MFVIQPLGCIFYPVAALPGWLQPICWALPPTYVFEGLRSVLIGHVLRADLMFTGLAIDSLLFAGPTLSALSGCSLAHGGREPCCKRENRSPLSSTNRARELGPDRRCNSPFGMVGIMGFGH